MASTAFTNGLEALMDNSFDYTSTIKSMLIKNTYPENPDQPFVSFTAVAGQGTSFDLRSNECDATGLIYSPSVCESNRSKPGCMLETPSIRRYQSGNNSLGAGNQQGSPRDPSTTIRRAPSRR